MYPGKNKYWSGYKEAFLCQLAADNKLSGSDQAVGIILVKHVNQVSLEAYPAVDTITLQINRNRSTIQRSIKRLIDRGHIIIIKHGGGAGRGRRENTNHYKFVLKEKNPRKTENADENKRAAAARPLNSPDDAIRAAPPPIKGRSQAPLRAATAPPEPKKKPYREPIGLKKISGLVRKSIRGKKNENPTDFKKFGNRQAYARQKIAEHIGPANGGYDIVMAAEDPADENHKMAVDTCRKVAKKIGVGWHSCDSGKDKT